MMTEILAGPRPDIVSVHAKAWRGPKSTSCALRVVKITRKKLSANTDLFTCVLAERGWPGDNDGDPRRGVRRRRQPSDCGNANCEWGITRSQLSSRATTGPDSLPRVAAQNGCLPLRKCELAWTVADHPSTASVCNQSSNVIRLPTI